jgi:hypothetical protein
LFNPKTQFAFLQLNENLPSGPVRYVAYFKRSNINNNKAMTKKEAPALLTDLDRQKVLQLVEEMKDAGMLSLSDALTQAVDDSQSISVYDLESVFKSTAVYTYKKAKPLKEGDIGFAR